MPLVAAQEILLEAKRQGYGIGAFNIYNLETVQGVIAAAERKQSPVIIQAWAGIFRFGIVSMETLAAIVKAEAARTSVPVALHLDHGESLEEVELAIQAGFGSVMLDASAKRLEENIALTKKAVRIAHQAGVGVEAELGHVGTGDGTQEKEEVLQNWLTDPKEAVRFVRETGVDFLAVAVGTIHGFYRAEPRLDLPRLQSIAQLLAVPLVLHGSSYTPDRQLQEAIKAGISKINVATELNVAFVQGIKHALAANAETCYPNELTGQGRDFLARVVEDKIEIFGSAGREDR